MCNRFSNLANQEAVIKRTRAKRDRTGNLPLFPDIFPDTVAPVVRTAPQDGVRELTMMRWGFPPPPDLSTAPVTNVRNTASSFWRHWLQPEFRCLVPVTSFCEWSDSKPKVAHWFALSEEQPVFFFAGIWRTWNGPRGPKKAPVEGDHLLYSFLTCEPNADVKPIHAKAMPVVLTVDDDLEAWLTGPIEDALKLQRPAPNGLLTVVASGTGQHRTTT
jgi:putative SOS response-associated peptidase YedK